MLDRFTKTNLVDLARVQNDPCVTICLLTEKTGREIYKAATRLKQLVKSAELKLVGNWMGEAEAREFLLPIMELIDDDTFWQETDQGLALFLSTDGLQKWRLPKLSGEHVFVSDRFFLRPILPATHFDPQFFVLALSQNKSELFKADHVEIKKIELPNMPASVAAAMNLTSVDRGSQVHTGSSEYGGKRGSVYHGGGGKSDSSKEATKYFFRQVNQSVAEYLSGKRIPLVLACVADNAPIYREVNTYPLLLEQVAAGNSDQMSHAELHTRTMVCMNEHMNLDRRSAIHSFQQMVNTTRTLSEASSILAAAYRGQIDTLVIDETASAINGAFRPADQTIDYEALSSDFDRDLLEEAVAQTILHRGEVLALTPNEMPNAVPMVAMLRY